MPIAQGKLIAAVGIPGCGKSTLFRALGAMHDLAVFNEPEAEQWPEAVRLRNMCGQFTALSWFRSMRVPQLYRANQCRIAGQTVLVDSFYDKLCTHYLGRRGTEWLMDPADPYFDLASTLAERDAELLPDADALVLIKLDEPTWQSFLNARHRELDADESFRNSFATQDYFESAARRYCLTASCQLIVHSQSTTVPADESARILSSTLVAQSVIEPK